MASEEEELDRVMVQTWQAVAQALRQTSARIDNDLRNLRRERSSERMVQARQLDFDRRQLAAWKSSHHATLNRGFDSVLRATVLNPSVQQDPSRLTTVDLAKAWMVADQMNDVRFIKDKTDAKAFIEHQWSQRGIEQPVSEFADGLVNHVSITAAGPSDGLDATLEAFQRAGAAIDPVRFVDPSEVEGFIRDHHGQSFSVSTTLAGSWDGVDNDRLAQAVLTSPVSDTHARVKQLRDGSVIGQNDRNAGTSGKAEVRSSGESAEISEPDGKAEASGASEPTEVPEPDAHSEVPDANRSAEVPEPDAEPEVSAANQSDEVSKSDGEPEVPGSGESAEVPGTSGSAETPEAVEDSSSELRASQGGAKSPESGKSAETGPDGQTGADRGGNAKKKVRSKSSGSSSARGGGDVFGEMSPAQEVAAARREVPVQGPSQTVEAPVKARPRHSAHVSV